MLNKLSIKLYSNVSSLIISLGERLVQYCCSLDRIMAQILAKSKVIRGKYCLPPQNRDLSSTTKMNFEKVVGVFEKVQDAMDCCENFPVFYFKPQQILCWDYLLNGQDVIAILPTGFGKSTVFHLLPYILPFISSSNSGATTTSSNQNIVLVVGPLNSIMDDQMKFLSDVGIPCGVVRFLDTDAPNNKLFPEKSLDIRDCDDPGNSDDLESEGEIDFSLETLTLSDDNPTAVTVLTNEEEELGIPDAVVEGKCTVVFGHPEAFLSPKGLKLLVSDAYQKNVVAIVIDEAHCIETW